MKTIRRGTVAWLHDQDAGVVLRAYAIQLQWPTEPTPPDAIEAIRRAASAGQIRLLCQQIETLHKENR